MSRWSSQEFPVETSIGEVMVSIEVAAVGSYDEPEVELDGDILIKTLASDSWLTLKASGLSAADIRLIEDAADRALDETLENHSCDISQQLIERAADAAYDAWKDRDYE